VTVFQEYNINSIAWMLYCQNEGSNCYAKHPEKRPKDEDNLKKDIPKGPQKPNPKS
jgi:hypothetical protein